MTTSQNPGIGRCSRSRPDHRAHGLQHGLLVAEPRILGEDDFHALRRNERARDGADVDAGAELEQRDLGLLALRHAGRGVEGDRVPDDGDLPVGVALPRQEVGGRVRTVDLEAVLADELLHEAEVVQHRAEEEHLLIVPRAPQRSGVSPEGEGAHHMVEQERG
jgi:hypothetical protein